MRLMPTPTSFEALERRIQRFRKRAQALEQREQKCVEQVEKLRGDLRGRRWRTGRATRALARADRRLEEVRAKRREVVQAEFNEIMRALEMRSRRTRDELDRAMAPLVGIALDWGQIERTFELLDEATGSPEIECFVAEARGKLSVPPFPVREDDGYVTPFPRDAFVF
jgi:chromosome segregation ATPase